MVRVGVVARISLADVVGHLETVDDRLRAVSYTHLTLPTKA